MLEPESILVAWNRTFPLKIFWLKARHENRFLLTVVTHVLELLTLRNVDTCPRQIAGELSVDETQVHILERGPSKKDLPCLVKQASVTREHNLAAKPGFSRTPVLYEWHLFLETRNGVYVNSQLRLFPMTQAKEISGWGLKKRDQ